MPLLGKRLIKPKGFLVIARLVSGLRILKIPRHHGGGAQHECGYGCEEGAHNKSLFEDVFLPVFTRA